MRIHHPSERQLYALILTPRQLVVLRRVLLRELLEGDDLSRGMLRAWLRELDRFDSPGLPGEGFEAG